MPRDETQRTLALTCPSPRTSATMTPVIARPGPGTVRLQRRAGQDAPSQRRCVEPLKVPKRHCPQRPWSGCQR
jgi:hypothetical protein